MQQALERALDRAESIIESVKQRPPKRRYPFGRENPLFQKLYDIYVEECGKEPEDTEELRSNVNLLEKLLKREPLPCLVLNLYPGKEGYSLMLKGNDETFSETIRVPYEEKDLLEYFDAEELPPILIDVLEKSQINIFHCGCVIAEIRDYRQCSNMEPPGYQSRHILLHPTMQTLACDIHSITDDGHKWTEEDKLKLESQLILATAEPLCLDPSIVVTCTENRLLYNKQKMNTGPMKRNFMRYSWPNRQQELSHCPPPELKVLDFCRKEKERNSGQQRDLRISKAASCVDTWKQRPCDLAMPSEVDVEKFATKIESFRSDDLEPTVWPDPEAEDDCVFGRDAGGQFQKTKVSIMQSFHNPLVSGKLWSRRKARRERQMCPPQISPGEQAHGSRPTSQTDAGREVHQYQELVQSKAKSPDKVSHSPSASASVSQLSSGNNREEPQPISIQPSGLGKGVNRTPPVQLASSSGSNFPPLQAGGILQSLTPAPAPASVSAPGKSSVDLRFVSMPPAAACSASSSSQATPATQAVADSTGLKIVKLVGPIPGVQALVSGSNAVLSCATGAPAPAGMNAQGLLSSGGQLVNAQSASLQATPESGVHLSFKDRSGVKPLALLQLPPGSLIMNTQQQQQFLLISPEHCQQTIISHPPQLASQASARGSSSQGQASPAQQPVPLKLSGAGSFVQPQAAVLSQLGSAQTQPGQSLPQLGSQLPSALSQQRLQT
uniref:Spt20-like SEP domain-containing protein n=1 Tax=Otolemur garnettii TaxID=30611 RepID=H0XQ45_OTOGA